MKLTKAAVLGFLLGLCALGHAETRPARLLTLDIASQPLSNALGQLAKQAGLQIVFHSNVGKDLVVSRLSGQYTAEAALGKQRDCPTARSGDARMARQ